MMTHVDPAATYHEWIYYLMFADCVRAIRQLEMSKKPVTTELVDGVMWQHVYRHVQRYQYLYHSACKVIGSSSEKQAKSELIKGERTILAFWENEHPYYPFVTKYWSDRPITDKEGVSFRDKTRGRMTKARIVFSDVSNLQAWVAGAMLDLCLSANPLPFLQY
jgi:hypothetical protein